MATNFEARSETYKHIKLVNKLIIHFAQELLDRAIEHDSSKLEEPEASLFEGITQKLEKTHYNSTEYHEQLKELGPALKHHWANNRHHPQHFKNGIAGFNLVDLVEMFLDWYAASKRQMDGNIHKSIDENQTIFNYSDELKQIMKNTIDLVENF